MHDVENNYQEILTPSYHGELCRHNGENPDCEITCDECDYYLTCFPDWENKSDDKKRVCRVWHTLFIWSEAQQIRQLFQFPREVLSLPHHQQAQES